MSIETKLECVLEGKAYKGTLKLNGETFNVYLGKLEQETTHSRHFDPMAHEVMDEFTTKHIFTICEV